LLLDDYWLLIRCWANRHYENKGEDEKIFAGGVIADVLADGIAKQFPKKF